MATLLRMPEVAAGATEAVLLEWLVRENASFTAGDPIAVVETDKASVEIAAETDAVLLRTLVPGGTVVEVGSPVALLGGAGDTTSDADRLLAELGVTEAKPKPPVATPNGSAARIFVSPLARKLLKEAGLTPEQVRGTGPGGRIVRRDVETAVAHARQSTPPPDPQRTESVARPGVTEIPHSRLRRAIAHRVTTSKQMVPHFYVKRTARIDALLALREQLNTVSPHKISVNDLVLRAVALSHQAIPEANVAWTDDALLRFDSVDIGVAIDSERGLVTPVLRGVERTSPSAIAAGVRAFVKQANEGALAQSDLEGGSITVTNLGMFGVEEFSAIINPPQSAILAVGAGVRAPVVADDGIAVATQLALVLSVDHRAIDGALAARWMAALVRAIEEPLRLVA